MGAARKANGLGYGILTTGVILAFVSAVVPFYGAGHQLLFGVFVAGITPYLAYALAVVLLRRPVTNVAGGLLLAGHVVLVAAERFIDGADYSDGSIVLVPLVFTLLLVPLVVQALRAPWHG